MKFGKVLTYRDIEEAKKLIGKKVIANDYLKIIERDCEEVIIRKGVLTAVSEKHGFEIDRTYNYQFIREVIDESYYRPFKDCNELFSFWESNYCNKKNPFLPNPTIFVRSKNTDSIVLLYILRGSCDHIWMWSPCEHHDVKDLFENYEFLDGHPCGIRLKNELNAD